MVWKKLVPRRPSSEVVLRVVADAVLVNAALALSFMGRFLTFFLLREEELISNRTYMGLFSESLMGIEHSAGLLTVISLIVFWMSGFYTYGRAYQSKYKLLIVFQAVSLSFLIFVVCSFFVPFVTPFPRSMLFGSWLLSLVLLIFSRVWSYLWTRATINGKNATDDRKGTKNVLVIGGAGYIGSIFVRKLLAKGYNVKVLDALIYGDEGIRELYGTPHFDFIKGDLRDIEAVVGAMQGIDSVVHLGALVGDPACAIDEKLTLEINLAATRMICEVAKGYGVQRFIFASTCSVYGASDELLNERSALNPVSLYARSKIASEEVVLHTLDERFAPTIVRFATIFGMSPRPRFDLVVNFLTARAVADGSITIMGGDQWRPFLHVADAAESLLRCLETPPHAVRGEILNVGSDAENYQITQIGNLIKQVVPDVKVITAGGADADRRNYRVSFKKFVDRVGFVPSRTVPSGIEEILDAIKSGVIDNYLNPKYNNHKTLTADGMTGRIQRTNSWTPLYQDSMDDALLQPGRTKHGRKESVLVIDDDEMHLVLMQNILELEEYELFKAADGPTGIAIFKERHPDVVLLDLGLVGMQGLDVLKELRRVEPNARIIIVTGHGSLESQEAFRHGAWDYLRKPFDVAELLAKVRSAADKRAPTPPPALPAMKPA